MKKSLVSALLVGLVACKSKGAEPSKPAPETGKAANAGSANTPAPPAPPAPPKPTPKELLMALGKTKLAELQKAYPDHNTGEKLISVEGKCTRANAEETTTAVAAIDAWIKASKPKLTPMNSSDITLGCVETNGLVADVHVDMQSAGAKPTQTGFWWTLRINNGKITVIDSVTGPAQETWMEWVQEKSLYTLLLVDLDHDGLLDVVSTKVGHEGGSPMSDFEVKLFPTAKPAALAIGQSSNLSIGPTQAQPLLDKGTLILELLGKTKSEAVCVTTAKGWTNCPEAAEALKIENALAAAALLAQLSDNDLRDREVLVESLTALGIPAAEQESMLPPAPPSPATGSATGASGSAAGSAAPAAGSATTK